MRHLPRVRRFVPRSSHLFFPFFKFIIIIIIDHSLFSYYPRFTPHYILQRRKTNNKPRDSSTATGDTAAESVRNLIKKNPKYSKRINYDALKDLFVESGGLPSIAANMTTGDDDKDEADLYTMDDDKSDGEGMAVIVEEEAGTVALKPASETRQPRKGIMALQDMDGEREADDGTDDEKDDDVWEDAYEQEV